MELLGKVGLVSGASRGIGRAIAIGLAEAGCDVVVNYCSSRDHALSVVDHIRGLGRRAIALGADVSRGEEVAEMIKEGQTALGPISILVNNAAINRDRTFLKLTYEQWREVIQVNLDGAFHLSQQLLPQMIQSGWGRIIFITSVVGQMGNFGQANYAATKGGLVALTKTLAREVARKGVTVNAVAPGYIETDMTANIPDSVRQNVCQITCMGRLGNPDEVSWAVRFLAAPAASYVTGQVIGVNGGMYM